MTQSLYDRTDRDSTYILSEYGALVHFRAIRILVERVGAVYSEQYDTKHTVALTCPSDFTSRTATGLIMEVVAEPCYLTTPWGEFNFNLPIRAGRKFNHEVFLAKLAEAGVKLERVYTRGPRDYYCVTAVGEIKLPVAVIDKRFYAKDVPNRQALWEWLIEQTTP